MKKSMANAILSIALGAFLLGSGSQAQAKAQDQVKAQTQDQTKDGAQAAAGVDTFKPAHSAADFAPDTSDILIQIAHGSGADTVVGRTCDKFAELLTDYSGGKIRAEVYPNGSLYSVAEMSEAVKNNSVQVIAGSPNSNLVPGLGVLELPELVESVDQAHQLLQTDSEFSVIINSLFDEAGIRLLAMEPDDFRVLTSNTQVRSYKDLAGLKVRIIDTDIAESIWTEWGAEPIPLAWSDVYEKLSEGMVEAQENPLDTIISGKLYEVQKYVIETNHSMFYTALMMSKTFYDGQTKATRVIIDAAAADAAAYAYIDARTSAENNRKLLQDAGMTFISLKDKVRDKMRDHSTEANKIVKKSLGEETYQWLMAAMGY